MATTPVVRSPRPPKIQGEEARFAPNSFSSPQGGVYAFGTPDAQQRTTTRAPRIVGEQSQPTTPSSPPTRSKSPATYGSTGGTPAPTSSPTTPVASGGGTQPPAGSPDVGMPNTTINVIPTAQGIADRTEAEGGWNTAQSQYNQDLATAAMNYGTGPAGATNPNSALALASLRAQQRQETATANRGAAKTIESSLFGEDKAKIGEAHSREDLAAYQRYQLAIQKYNDALAKAREAYESGMRKGSLADVEGAERRLPEPGTIGKVRTSTTRAKSKILSPKITKTSSQKVSVSKTVSVKSAGKVPKVKLK